MEFRLDIIERELLRLKKMELVQFIISKRLPVKLQKVTVVIDFLIANESRCCRCSNGQVIPITFYSSEKAIERQNLIETKYDISKPTCVWLNSESTIAETKYVSTAQTNESTVSAFNAESLAPIFKSAVSKSTFLPTGLTKNVQGISLEIVTAEENLNNTNIKIECLEFNEENEENFNTSRDECKPFIENEQLENADDKKALFTTKVEKMFQCELCNYKTHSKRYINKHRMQGHSLATPVVTKLKPKNN